MYIVLHIKDRYSCQILMKLEFSRQIFEKHSNIKFREHPSNGGPSCTMRTDGRTDTRKPIVAFRNFVKALNLSGTCQDSQFSIPVLKRELPEYKFISVPLKQHG